MELTTAHAIIEHIHATYPGRIAAKLDKRLACAESGRGYAVDLQLVTRGRHFRIRYPDQLPKALEAWAVFFMTEEEIAALPPLPDPLADEEEDQDLEATITS